MPQEIFGKPAAIRLVLKPVSSCYFFQTFLTHPSFRLEFAGYGIREKRCSLRGSTSEPFKVALSDHI